MAILSENGDFPQVEWLEGRHELNKVTGWCFKGLSNWGHKDRSTHQTGKASVHGLDNKNSWPQNGEFEDVFSIEYERLLASHVSLLLDLFT